MLNLIMLILVVFHKSVIGCSTKDSYNIITYKCNYHVLSKQVMRALVILVNKSDLQTNITDVENYKYFIMPYNGRFSI